MSRRYVHEIPFQVLSRYLQLYDGQPIRWLKGQIPAKVEMEHKRLQWKFAMNNRDTIIALFFSSYLKISGYSERFPYNILCEQA